VQWSPRFDVLLLEIKMPEMSGVEVSRKLHKCGMAVRILVVSIHSVQHYVSLDICPHHRRAIHSERITN
jgi:FixJ family two-component response regulator